MVAVHPAAIVLTTTIVLQSVPIMSLRPGKPAMAIVPPPVMMGLSAPPILLTGVLRIAMPLVVSRISPLAPTAMDAARLAAIIITTVIAHPIVAIRLSKQMRFAMVTAQPRATTPITAPPIL